MFTHVEFDTQRQQFEVYAVVNFCDTKSASVENLNNPARNDVTSRLSSVAQTVRAVWVAATHFPTCIKSSAA
uniref:Kinesin motor domain-containing protein n=1 Tax=Panagrellus redivivus TaxID=6233 RepID=A0A7E4ZRK2_PANRE